MFLVCTGRKILAEVNIGRPYVGLKGRMVQHDIYKKTRLHVRVRSSVLLIPAKNHIKLCYPLQFSKRTVHCLQILAVVWEEREHAGYPQLIRWWHTCLLTGHNIEAARAPYCTILFRARGSSAPFPNYSPIPFSLLCTGCNQSYYCSAMFVSCSRWGSLGRGHCEFGRRRQIEKPTIFKPEL